MSQPPMLTNNQKWEKNEHCNVVRLKKIVHSFACAKQDLKKIILVVGLWQNAANLFEGTLDRSMLLSFAHNIASI